MEKYESKQVQILRPSAEVYMPLCDFSRFTSILEDKVENWQADEDSCSFTVKGFNLTLRIVERDLNKLIRIEPDDGAPLEAVFWIQLKEISPGDTRMRLLLHAKLNMMMKMMIGSKLKDGLDKVAEAIAEAFNNPEMAKKLFEQRQKEVEKGEEEELKRVQN